MSGLAGTSHSRSKLVGLSRDTATAWVNFNGTGTVAIRDSYNVDSISDQGTGSYKIMFSQTLGDANYAFFGDINALGYWMLRDFASYATTSYLHIEIRATSTAMVDKEVITCLIYGGHG